MPKTKTSLQELITGTGYYQCNKTLIKNLGVSEAIFFTALLEQYSFYAQKGKLKDNAFFCTVEKIEEDLGYTAITQRKYIKDLESRGLIKVSYVGKFKRRHIEILDSQQLADIFTEILPDAKIKSKKANKQKSSNKNKKFDKKIFEKQVDKVASQKGTSTKTKKVLIQIANSFYEYYENYYPYEEYSGYVSQRLSNNTVAGLLDEVDELSKSKYGSIIDSLTDEDHFASICEIYNNELIPNKNNRQYHKSLSVLLSKNMLKYIECRLGYNQMYYAIENEE